MSNAKAIVEVEATTLDMERIRLKFHGLPGDAGPDLIMDPSMARIVIDKLSKCLPQSIAQDTYGVSIIYDPADTIFVGRVLGRTHITGHGKTRAEALAMVEDNYIDLQEINDPEG